MKMPNIIKRHWPWALGLAVGVAIYLYVTRVRVLGVVDASGDGMEINGKTWRCDT